MKKIKIFSAAFLAAMTLGLASCGDVEMSLGKASVGIPIAKRSSITFFISMPNPISVTSSRIIPAILPELGN